MKILLLPLFAIGLQSFPPAFSAAFAPSVFPSSARLPDRCVAPASVPGARGAASLSFLAGTSDDAGDSTDRRGFFGKALGGAVAAGLVANKIAIEGPEPYAPIPRSLVGKVIVITGGNTGLGLESAKRLALGGATVIITSRSREKGERAAHGVEEYLEEKGVGEGGGSVYSLPLDLCDLESVRAFPDLLRRSAALSSGSGKIDVLLNNAGVMAVPDLQITKDGYEKTFQTNHLGHFALTALLSPLLNPDGSRVINVSSMAYLIAGDGLDLEGLNGEGGYGPWTSYGASKLENILFTKELQRRADEAGRKISAVALHPGAVRTELARYIIGEEKSASMQESKEPNPIDMLALAPGLYFTKGVDRGATSQIWLGAGQGENVEGKFYQNCKEVKLNKFATDMKVAKKLWVISEQMSGVQFNL